MKYLTDKASIAFLLIFSLFSVIINAQETAPAPPDTFGVGPGARPTTPIDMYQIILLIVAIGLVTYFYKKIKLSKI